MNPVSGRYVRRFGTTQPIFESTEDSYRIGRLVANATFFKALFCHGDFDEYHLFCPTYANCRLTRERLEKEGFSRETLARISIHHLYSLPSMVSEADFQVFHVGGWGFFWPGLVAMRERMARRAFPVTGLTHSLNATETPFEALKVCTAPARSFDSIICTSLCGMRALRKILTRVEEDFGGLGAAYGGRLDVIPLGIEDRLTDRPDPAESRGRLHIRPDAFVLLYLGRLSVEYKMDPGPLLGTVRRLLTAHRGRDILFLLAGGMDSATQKILTELLAENGLQKNARVLSNFPDALKTHLYAASDVYVAPVDNLQETFGLSILEAMAHGCAVVASDFDGYAELIEDGRTGIKIPTVWADCLEDMTRLCGMMNFFTGQLLIGQSIAVDQKRLFTSLENLLLFPEFRRDLGRRARERVIQTYRWSSIIPRYLRLWEELHALSGTAPPDGLRSTKRCWWDVDYYGIFNHFVSHTWKEEDLVRRSPLGLKALAEGTPPLPYADVGATIVLPELVLRLLRQLGDDQRSVGEALDVLQGLARLSRGAARACALWMLKQGLLERVDPQGIEACPSGPPCDPLRVG